MGAYNAICICCEDTYVKNPRSKKQQYCSKRRCQRFRRAQWQQQKRARDADYRCNQARCQKQWQERNDGYYKRYRQAHPAYEDRNRAMQILRDSRRRDGAKGDRSHQMLAKMDSLLKPYYSRKGGRFKLFVIGSMNLAKMDALTVRLVPV